MARGVAFDEARVVFHKDRIMVAALEASGAQQMREPVRARLELPVSDRLARPAMMIAG
jgi:hypothetical protein